MYSTFLNLESICKEIQTAFKQGMQEDNDHPKELEELVEAIGRVEKALADKKSQQLIADFYMVYSFIQAFNEESDEDDFDFEEEEEEEESPY